MGRRGPKPATSTEELWGRYAAGYSLREIAAQVGRSPQNIHQRLTRFCKRYNLALRPAGTHTKH